MKKIFYLLAMVSVVLSSCVSNDDEDGPTICPTSPSQYVSRVLEFVPAPGQFTNRLPTYTTGDNAQVLLDKVGELLIGTTSNFISLGAYGGYIVLGFDHSIINKPNAKDFKVYGNAFDNSAEPGIVMVSRDANGNGLPDDAWYELAGSEYAHSTRNYAISYIRPNPINGNVPWFDNQGNHDTIRVVNGYSGVSYFPQWVTADTITFSGTLLPDNATNDGIWKLPSFAWGYADNVANTNDGCKFDIGWAVDSNGNTAVLEKIDFIKIYTAVRQTAGPLGEISTEVAGVEDLNMEE